MPKHKVSVGDKVQWVCTPSWYHHEKPFKATGRVIEIKNSTFGGKLRGKGASIEVSTKKFHEIYMKKRTFVSVENLTILD